jgi:hypothetical protein
MVRDAPLLVRCSCGRLLQDPGESLHPVNGDIQAALKTFVRKLCELIQLGRVGDNGEILW